MSGPRIGILEGHDVVELESITDPRYMRMWHDTGLRRVAFDVVGEVTVSTVFLGMDHAFGLSGGPLWFETMTFGDRAELQLRYATWDQAAEGHRAVVNRLRRRRG